MLNKKGGKEKDPEAGGEEESKELLDDKEEKKEGEQDETEGGKGFMDYLRSAVPPLFKKSDQPAKEDKELEEVKVRLYFWTFFG